MLLNCHMCQFTIAVNFSFKIPLFREKGICSSEISVWGVFDSYNLHSKKYQISKILITNFFSKKDTDSKTDF